VNWFGGSTDPESLKNFTNMVEHTEKQNKN